MSKIGRREVSAVDALDQTTGGSDGSIAPSPVDPGTLQKLAALGYIGAITDRPPAGGAPRPDPKAMIGVFNRLRHANALIRTGRFADVESVARDVVTADPTNAFATMILGRAEMEQGKYREAIAHCHAYAGWCPRAPMGTTGSQSAGRGSGTLIARWRRWSGARPRSAARQSARAAREPRPD